MIKVDSISRKQFIINSAADLFQEKGYNATSIRDLASKVGLEPSSIYSHIKSKEELLSEICMACAHKFMAGMDDIYFQDISPKKKIKALIILHLDMAYDDPASVIVFNDEWRFLTEPIKSDFLHARKEYEKKFKKILSDGKNGGKFDFDNEDLIFNIIIKTLSWSYKAIKKYKKVQLEAQLLSFIQKAIKN